MCENVNPKVIVDDDFLDLRNVQSKPFSRRPISAHSITKRSSSINTQGKASTVKEVLPGLQRLLNTYNKKNSNSFGYNRNNRGNDQPVDCRFRRKVENKTLTSRSESILQENEETRIETSRSDVLSRSNSSECEKQDEWQIQTILSESSKKEENCVKTKTDNDIPRSVLRHKIEAAKKDSIEIKKQNSNEKLSVIRNDCKENLKMKHVQYDMTKNIKIGGKDFEENTKEKNCITKKGSEFQGDSTKIGTSCGFYPLPTFKKSWTVPSLPQIQKYAWTKNYNALCAKVDRKTYEFDTDDTVSDSEDQLSTYSSISRSNYMNLIFCLGCLCGIFLIGGILTASEIHADYFRPLESEDGMFEFFYSRISNTFRFILSVFQQILILPGTKLFRTSVEPTQHWSVLTKYLYFLPE